MTDSELETLLASYDPPVRELALAARDLVLEFLSQAHEKVQLGWKSIAFSCLPGMKTHFCSLILQSRYINLVIMRSSELPDPAGLLEGSSKNAKYVKIRSREQLDSPALHELLVGAVALLRAQFPDEERCG